MNGEEICNYGHNDTFIDTYLRLSKQLSNRILKT